MPRLVVDTKKPGTDDVWFETLPTGKSWSSLWHGYIRCSCGGIRRFEGICVGCGESMPHYNSTTVQMDDGTQHKIPSVHMGGEGRYEDWVYLIMLEREWLRPISEADRFLNIAESSRSSPRAILVLIFWTYFETRIERLYRQALEHLPAPIVDDLLRRYSTIGARLDKLYKVSFGTTYLAELENLGYSDISQLLARIHKQRNKFAHGHPEAIDDRRSASGRY